MQQLLHTISQHLPRKQIFHTLTDQSKVLVLERFNLLSFENGPGLVLHRFVHSDPDRGYHDHPWGFGVSLILSGSYKEIKVSHSNRMMSQKEFRAGSVNYFSGKDYHRVLLKPKLNSDQQIVNKKVEECNEEIVDEYEVWTLFFHWKRVKTWGFLKEEQESQDGWKFNPYSKTVEDSDGAWWKVKS